MKLIKFDDYFNALPQEEQDAAMRGYEKLKAEYELKRQARLIDPLDACIELAHDGHTNARFTTRVGNELFEIRVNRIEPQEKNE